MNKSQINQVTIDEEHFFIYTNQRNESLTLNFKSL